MTSNPSTRARGVPLALLPLFILAAGSCGGDDIAGPPDDPGPVAVASVELKPASLTLKVGLSAQLTATPRATDGTPLADRTVTWSTENTAIATVSATGSVTAVTTGQVRITATSGGKSGTATVTVSAVSVASVAVTPPSASLAAGATVQLTAEAKDAGGQVLPGRPATWSSDKPGVAQVSATGLVSGVAAGEATITATVEGKTGTATITVAPAVGTIRTWKGGASGHASAWSAGGNWSPAGVPAAMDTARVPAAAHPAVVGSEVRIARLIVAGGRVRAAGHPLIIKEAE